MSETKDGFAQMDAEAQAKADDSDAAVIDAPETDDPVVVEPTETELRIAGLRGRIEAARALAMQAKRQNMMDHLADAVAALAAIMLDELV